MSKTTIHGENIAGEIQGEDVYGHRGDLTLADVWSIIDNIHSHYMDQDCTGDNLDHLQMFESWMSELESIDEDLPL